MDIMKFSLEASIEMLLEILQSPEYAEQNVMSSFAYLYTSVLILVVQVFT